MRRGNENSRLLTLFLNNRIGKQIAEYGALTQPSAYQIKHYKMNNFLGSAKKKKNDLDWFPGEKQEFLFLF